MPPGCDRRLVARCACRCRPTGSSPATTPRRELDAALVDLAVAGGCDGSRKATRSTTFAEVPTSVVVDVDGHRTIRPGMSSPPTECGRRPARPSGVGEPGYLGEWHAFRQYARNVTGPAAERLIVWFEPDLLPGYMWSFPLPGRPGQRRLRRAARRRAAGARHEAGVGRPVAPTARRRGARCRVRVGGSPHRLADSGRDRPGDVDRRTGCASSATQRWPPTR